jgi:hypothetical protein
MTTSSEILASLPQSLEPEFVMTSPDESIRLAIGIFDLLREGRSLGTIEGELTLEWSPRLRLICRGKSDTYLRETQDNLLKIYIPSLGLTSEISIEEITRGKHCEIQAQLISTYNPKLQSAERFRFYLVNFPHFLGESVRTESGFFVGASRSRLRMTAGSLVCTVDRINGPGHFEAGKSTPGYLLTHVAEVQRPGFPLAPSELQNILDALYWIFTFMRGAKTGPVLPSFGFPFVKNWISAAPWTVNEPRRVDSWMPDRSSIDINSFFETFIARWNDPKWNEALRTTIAWYVAANAPSSPSEAKITLCQIALEVLASLQEQESSCAHERIRGLLEGLNIPTKVPPRLRALHDYATKRGIDAPECLTQIRNKLEHPTAKNRRAAEAFDGITRTQAAQYGIELFELCLLAIMNYRGKYARRAFQGWKGEDEIPVPWA